ncbi:MAG: hypothetical protein ACQEQE_09060 [Bacillota bacterium]
MLNLKNNNPQEVKNQKKWIEKENDLIKYIYPQSYLINFEGNFHVKKYKDKDLLNQIFEEFVKKIDFEKTSDTSIQEIYDRGHKNYLHFKFPVDMSIDRLYSLFNKDFENLDKEIKIQEVYIYNDNIAILKNEKKVYKVENINIKNFDKIFKQYDEPLIQYNTVESIYSLKEKIKDTRPNFYPNDTVVPRNKFVGIPIINVVNEINLESDKISGYVKKVLGDSFVKKVKDYNDSLIYMVNYGKRALKFDKNGSLEYKAKITQEYENLSFKNGLDKSLNAIKTLGDIPVTTYLTKYETFEKENITYQRYSFNYSISGLEIKFEKPPIIVELNGNNIVLIKRNLKKFIGSEDVRKVWESSMPLNRILNKNMESFKNNYFYYNDNEYLTLDNYIYHILQDINGLKLKYYYMDSEDDKKLIPIWELKIRDITYLINIYNGEIVSVINEGARE